MSKTTGGPAFPFGQISEATGQPVNGFYDPGMTLRDYFAAKALEGLLSGRNHIAEVNVRLAYEYADAMLKEREK